VEYIAHLQVETCFIDIANWGTPPVFLNHCNMYYSQLNPVNGMECSLHVYQIPSDAPVGCLWYPLYAVLVVYTASRHPHSAM